MKHPLPLAKVLWEAGRASAVKTKEILLTVSELHLLSILMTLMEFALTWRIRNRCVEQRSAFYCQLSRYV